MTTQQPDIPGTPGPITPDLEEHTALTHPDQPVAVPAPDQRGPAQVSPTGQDTGADPATAAQGCPYLTTAHGVRLQDSDHSLKAGDRGPTLLEDFHLREKITHFDHERIPERVVHARGAAAHGVFTSAELEDGPAVDGLDLPVVVLRGELRGLVLEDPLDVLVPGDDVAVRGLVQDQRMALAHDPVGPVGIGGEGGRENVGYGRCLRGE